METSNQRNARIAVDVGGTFTDLVMVRENTGQLFISKTRTTPQDLSDGVMVGIEKLLDQSAGQPKDIANLFFGSTAAINAVLERKGARVGLITTQGFRHILEIARANIPGRLTNELTYVRPERLVPLEFVFEVPERSAGDGSILFPLDESATRDAIRQLIRMGVECIAVSLLHSYANPAHERRIQELINEQAPEMLVSLSSSVVPEYREYERTVTTVLNAYVMPVMDQTLSRLQTRLGEGGLSPSLAALRCDGGIMSAEAAIQMAVNTVLSGPAAGVNGAAYIARLAGYENVISLDMGGTSTDVSLATSGRTRITNETMISEYPVKVPILDIVTIGAGGGSIAYKSSTGALHVGPRSAGAVPGPVCYDQGGSEVTVTDANLVLGRIPPYLIGGEIELNVDRAQSAVGSLATEFGMSPTDLALGILAIINEKMQGAIRVVSVQRGYDPRDFILVPFGGAGPVHAGEMIRLLGIPKAVIPPTPGVLSAVGALVSDVTSVFKNTWLRRVDAIPVDEAHEIIDNLAARANEWLESEDISAESRVLQFGAELRYAGQAWEISVPVSPELTHGALNAMLSDFHAEHRRLYGFDWEQFVPVELVVFKVTAIGKVNRPDRLFMQASAADNGEAILGYRDVCFEGRFTPTACYLRSRLGVGQTIPGPAIIEQPDCTTVVFPGQVATVDHHHNLVLEEAQ